jgi:hypothetical protein
MRVRARLYTKPSNKRRYRMTEDKLIDGLLEKATKESTMPKDPKTGVCEGWLITGEAFHHAMRTALERQRRGCAEAYVKSVHVRNYTNETRNAILNAPPEGE